MPVLYDRQGKAHDVPDEQVTQAIASGQYAFGKGTSVIMKGPAGEVMEGPAEEVSEMLRRGYSIETGAEQKERVLQEEYGGVSGQVLTAAHAAGNVLTFGGLDYLGEKIGGKEYTEPVKKAKAANPTLNTVAELGTLVGSFLLPGGQAGALAKITKLPRGLARVGRGVEKVVLKGLAGPKGGMIRQALAKGTALGTGASLEGAVYGGGQFLSETALGETEATAENLLANVGMGAMWGGIAGGGFGAGGEILRRGLGAGANFAKRSSKSVVNMWERATGNKAHPDLAMTIEQQIAKPRIGKYAKVAAPMIQEDVENVARFLQRGPAGKEARRVGGKSLKQRDEYVTRVSDDLDTLVQTFDDAAEQMTGAMKIRNMGSINAVRNEVAAATDATAQIETALAKVDEMLAATDEIAGATYMGAPRARLKSARKTLRRHQKKLAGLKPEKYGEKLHGTVDSLKRDLQKYTNTLKKARGKDLATDDVFRALDEIQEGFRLHLESEAFYGAVGIVQGKFNSVWSRTIGRGKTSMARKIREKVGEAAWRDVYATNRGGVEHMINDMGRARNKNMEEFFLNQIDDKLEFIKLTRETFEDLPASLSKNLAKAEEVALRLRKNYQAAQETVTLQNQMGDIIQKSTQLQGILPMGAGAGIGYLLGGEEGLALGLGLSVFTNPGRLIQIRAALDRMASTTDLKIVKAVKRYLGKATGKIKKIKKPARAMIAPTSMKILQQSNWGEKRTQDKTRREAFKRRTKELTEFLTNPDKIVERMNRNVGDIDEVAPNVATAMKMKAVKSARYLHDKAPKPRDRGALLTGKFKPPDHELAKFERIAAVVDGGAEVVMRNLEAGILTVPEVEAFRETWPKQYERVVVTLVEQIPELHEKLPYERQVQIGILFGVPVHPTMEIDFRQAISMLDQIPQIAPGETPGPTQPKSKMGDFKDLSIDKASMSDTQGVELRKLT